MRRFGGDTLDKSAQLSLTPMARTAPAPNIPPIPGMCPGIAVLAGNGGAGGGSGKGSKKGGGKKGAGKKKGKKGAKGGKKNGKCGGGAKGKCSKCGTQVPRGDPVDVASGAVFTNEALDLELPGPLPLHFHRHYESANAELDLGLGFGWSHSFAHRVEVRRRTVEYWDENGGMTEFPSLRGDEKAIGGGMILSRDGDTFVVDTLEDVYYHLARVDGRTDYVLVAITDNNHNKITIEWLRGQISRIVDSVGRIITVEAARDGRIGGFAVENAPSPGYRHVAATYTYDADGNLVAATDAGGFTERYTYDREHYLTSVTPPDGLTFHFIYDHAHRCIESWGAMQDGSIPGLSPDVPKVLADGVTVAKGLLHVKLDFIGEGYVEVADSQNVQRYIFNEDGLITKAVSGDTVSEREFDAGGHMLSYVDPMGARTAWTRDRFGRIVSEESPRGNVTVNERDEGGRLAGVFDSVGRIARIRRDARGNPVERVMAMGDLTRVQYDARGLPVEEWFPDGTRNRYEYDAHGNMITVVRHNGAVWRYAYDALGRQASATNPLGETNRWITDARGDIVQVEFADGSFAAFEYDGQRNATRRVDGDGRSQQLWYNGRDQVVAIKWADGTSLRYEYDREENLVTIYNERGDTRRLGHNSNGDVTSIESFDKRRTDFKVNANGELIEASTARGAVTFVRGVDGQVEEVLYPDGTSAAFGFDIRGRLLRAGGESNERPWEILWERNAAGFVIREAQTFAGQTELVDRDYDSMRRDAAVRSSVGHEVTIQRDELGLIRSLRADNANIDMVRDAIGREVRRFLGGAAEIEQRWDPNGYVLARRVVTGVSRSERGQPDWRGTEPPGLSVRKTFNYSPGGQLLSRSDRDFGPREYAHDARARVTEVRRGNDVVESYWHDEASNVHERQVPRVYEEGNVLRSRGTTDYRWDDVGRLIEKVATDADGGEDRWAYNWDGAGNLIRAERSNGTVVDFFYDAFSRRLGKRVKRIEEDREVLIRTCRYVWDEHKILHELRRELEAQNVTIERTFMYDDDGFPVGHRELRQAEGAPSATDSGWLFYVLDNRGAPEHIVTADGRIAGTLEHTAYGLATTKGVTTPLRFLGQFADEETGLHYNRYRYYDPEVGRYISQDPAGDLPDPNLYRYTHNPLISFDSAGLHEAFGWFTPGDGGKAQPLGNYDSNGGISSPSGTKAVNDIGKWNGDVGAQKYGTDSAKASNGCSVHNSYRPGDTERQILRDVNKKYDKDERQGSKVEILGQARPCKRCRTAMARWAKKNNATVTYKYTGQPHMEGAKGTGSGVFAVGPSGKPNWQENPKPHSTPIDSSTTNPRTVFNDIGVGPKAQQMGGPNGGVNPEVVNLPKHYTDF